MSKEVTLGCGLIGIGRPWGHQLTEVPSEKDVLAFLAEAYEAGINFYDTSPSYGLSESRFGLFLKSLSEEERKKLIVATKFGEHWDVSAREPFVDHSFDALRRSLDQSLELLGEIDVLELHKTSPQVLESEDFNRAIEHARSLGIATIGASVSDLESARVVCAREDLAVIQFPFNSKNLKFEPIFEWAKDKLILINRPFAMGALMYESQFEGNNQDQERIEAFKLILKAFDAAREINAITEKQGRLVVLTGTKNPDHLEENIRAFSEALSQVNI